MHQFWTNYYQNNQKNYSVFFHYNQVITVNVLNFQTLFTGQYNMPKQTV